MSNSIRIRDVVRQTSFNLAAEVPALRVPYDLFKPVGAVHVRGTLAEWREGGVAKTGRTAAAVLGEAHAGERVLLRLSDEPIEQWWLCEVEIVAVTEATSARGRLDGSQ